EHDYLAPLVTAEVYTEVPGGKNYTYKGPPTYQAFPTSERRQMFDIYNYLTLEKLRPDFSNIVMAEQLSTDLDSCEGSDACLALLRQWSERNDLTPEWKTMIHESLCESHRESLLQAAKDLTNAILHMRDILGKLSSSCGQGGEYSHIIGLYEP